MTNKVTVALPYFGGRYYLTLPSSVQPIIDYKLWGGGGGAGYQGGDGAGGNFVSGTINLTPSATIEVFVGAGGSGGDILTGGASYKYNNYNFAGGTGGATYDYDDNTTGRGGGGGGASAIIINDVITAVAGGGGSGAGCGDDYNFLPIQNATGVPNGNQNLSYYRNGGTNGRWSNLLNNYSVWEGDGSYTWEVYFPTTGDYLFSGSIDNYGKLYIDDSASLAINNYDSVYSTVGYITAGWHTIRIDGVNTGGPGAIGATISDNNTGTIIWTTRSPRYSGNGRGEDGLPAEDDMVSGGGGAGGGGYPYGGIGGGIGSGGANGLNYIINLPPYQIGEYASYKTPGGVTDANYPGNHVGYGATQGSITGGNGYALITFTANPSIHVKNDGEYRKILPLIKINGAYRSALTWAKIGGVWTAIGATSSSITFSTDGTKWG